jgi:hypothetical protein
MELMFQKSLVEKIFTCHNVFQNFTDDPNWGRIPFEIGIHSFKDYLNVEMTQIYQQDAILEVCKQINFLNFHKVGEIGGSPFVHAKTLHDKYSHLRFLLSDRHEVYYKTIQELEIFRNTEFFTFDTFSENYSRFIDCDLIMLWGVDLFYSDPQLIKLLKFISANNIKLLIGSRSVEYLKYSPKHNLRRIPVTNFLKRIIERDNSLQTKFVTSVYRSSVYFRKLSQVVRVNHTDLGDFGTYRVHVFE